MAQTFAHSVSYRLQCEQRHVCGGWQGVSPAASRLCPRHGVYRHQPVGRQGDAGAARLRRDAEGVPLPLQSGHQLPTGRQQGARHLARGEYGQQGDSLPDRWTPRLQRAWR